MSDSPRYAPNSDPQPLSSITLSDTPTQHANLPYRYQAHLFHAPDHTPDLTLNPVPHLRVGATIDGTLTLTALAPIPTQRLLLRLRYIVSGSGSPEVHVLSQRTLHAGPILPDPPLPTFTLHEQIPAHCPISYRGTYITLSWSLALVFIFSPREQWIDSIPLFILPALAPPRLRAPRPSMSASPPFASPPRSAVTHLAPSTKPLVNAPGALPEPSDQAALLPIPSPLTPLHAPTAPTAPTDTPLDTVSAPKPATARPPLIAPDGVTVLRPPPSSRA